MSGSGVDSAPGWGDEWDAVADVVVVGSGAAGLSAALAAAARGCSVIILERGAHPGGTTAKSSATMWLPNNPVMQRHGVTDDRDDALTFMARGAYPTMFAADELYCGLPRDKFALLEAFYDAAAVAFAEFAELGAIPYDDALTASYPDYYASFPQDAAPVGRSLRMVEATDCRWGTNPTGGQLFIDAMLAACTGFDVQLKLGRRVVHLVKDSSGAVLGVEARRSSGTVLVGARRGVVFATGGFLHDERLAATFLRGPVMGGAAAPTATGDFVRIGIESGAALDNMTHAWWSQVVVEAALRSRSTPHDCVYPFGDSMVIVNRFGDRVMNEKMPYNDRGQVHHYWDPTRLEYANLLLFMLFDETVMTDNRPYMRSRYPVPGPGDGREDVISASSWSLLAEAVERRLAEIGAHTGGVRLALDFPERLKHTIARYATMASGGVDHDFHRGDSMLEMAWSPALRPGLPNPTMRPLDTTGPYHCILLGPGALDTKGGPAIDPSARVLDVAGGPIPGLYGAGNCVGAPTGQAYYGPGGTVGPALTFGYLAGVNSAAESPRRPVY